MNKGRAGTILGALMVGLAVIQTAPVTAQVWLGISTVVGANSHWGWGVGFGVVGIAHAAMWGVAFGTMVAGPAGLVAGAVAGAVSGL